jgi:hypothetical protein
MSFTLERSLIETAYQSGMPNGSKIQFDNVPFIPPTSGGYTRLSVMSGGEGRRVEVTAAPHERVPGVIDVAIFIPPDGGSQPARTIADAVAGALANKTLTSGTTTIRTYGSRLDLIGKAGAWFQANVTIRFVRDTQ